MGPWLPIMNDSEVSPDIIYYSNLVLGFRMTELVDLMIFAGQSKSGKKVDLQSRALNLVRIGSRDIYLKIKQLSNCFYKSGDSTVVDTMSSSPSYSNPYHAPIPDSSATTSTSSNLHMPEHPDVELNPLPFYHELAVITKPTSLQPVGSGRFQERNIMFNLQPQQATMISSSAFTGERGRRDYRNQILLRFSLMETSSKQPDNLPNCISVRVNGTLCPLPPLPTKTTGVVSREPKPINITSFCKINGNSPNCVKVGWAVEVGKTHTLSIYLVEALNHRDLLKRLKDKKEKPPEYTKTLIKEKLQDQDPEIDTFTFKVSLSCPLGKARIQVPCRALSCDHLQIFDASTYLQMNERKQKWLCPVCSKSALYFDLVVDGFFRQLLESSRLPAECNTVILDSDGSWKPHTDSQPAGNGLKSSSSTAADKAEEQTIELSDGEDVESDEDDRPPKTVSSVPPKKRKVTQSPGAVIACVDIISSDEEDKEETKRSRLASVEERPGSPVTITLD